MYKATIIVERNGADVFSCIKPEEKDGTRSSYVVSLKGDSAVFNVTASDATSLRATMDGIIKLLIVFEKTKTIK